jgi:hypothetical protein
MSGFRSFVLERLQWVLLRNGYKLKEENRVREFASKYHWGAEVVNIEESEEVVEMNRKSWLVPKSASTGTPDASSLNSKYSSSIYNLTTPPVTPFRILHSTSSKFPKSVIPSYPMLVNSYPKTIKITYAPRITSTRPSAIAGLASSTFHGVPFEWVQSWNGSHLASLVPPTTYRDTSKQFKPLKRILANEKALIELLRSTASDWYSSNTTYWGRIPSHGIDFRVVDFASLSFEDQILTAMDTDLLVGTHGAVMIHQMYLRKQPLAGVLELKTLERWASNHQFENLARKVRIYYT